MTLQAAYLELLAANETAAPYRLSDAYGNDLDYGLSFGRKQIDLLTFSGNGGTVPDASHILARVMATAKAAGVEVLQQDITDVRAGALHHKAADVRVTRADLIARVDGVLDTAAGRAAVDAEEAGLIGRDIAAATARAARPGPAGDLLTASLAAKLVYLDYLNLFGSASGKFDPFLDGDEVVFTDGNHITLAKPAHLTELLRFIFSTLQGRDPAPNHRPDMLRRMNNVLVVARGNAAGNWAAALGLTAEDIAWFGAPFGSIWTPEMRAAAIAANGAPLAAFEALHPQA